MCWIDDKKSHLKRKVQDSDFLSFATY